MLLNYLKNNIYHLGLAFLSAYIFRFPSREIFVLGVTGTKGKSTVLELIGFILEKAGKKVAISSSIRNGESSMTMPGRFFLQRFLRRAVNKNCDYALVEVTSQGVLQNRHRFIKWGAAIFTNLSPEHIESHGSFEKYREAKLDFFQYVAHRKTNGLAMSQKLFLINKDDSNAKHFIEAAGGGGEIILYSKSEISSKLIGEFNKYNIGAAVAFVRSQGIDDEIIRKAVAEFSGAPGRMEFVKREPFSVVIDYAHTPDSLCEVYKTLRSEVLKFKVSSSNPKLICVLGAAGGGRDKWKRPEMGKIAAEYCDEIILTDEDPYDEQPEKIIEEIFSSCSQIRNGSAQLTTSPKSEILKIIDRKKAIKKAISLAKPGDTVVITGKGSEKWIHLSNGKKIPWSDKNEVLSHFLTRLI